MERRVYIIGAGALGLRLALALAARHPVLVAREAPSSRVLVRALDHAERVIEEREVPMEPLATLRELPEEAILFLCTKALAVKGVIEHLKPIIKPSHTVVLAQNGIGIAAIASKFLPSGQLVRLTARLGALKVAPYSIIPAGPVTVTVASSADAALRAAAVQEIFERCGAQVATAQSIDSCEWQKTALNVVTNTLATIMDAPNSVLLQDPELWGLATALLSEYRAVAAAEEIPLGDAAQPESIRSQIESVGANINSTLSDLRAGRATETPWMLGAFVERGLARAVPTPVAKTVLALLTSLERLALLQRGS